MEKLGLRLIAQERVKLDPSHIGLCNICQMATSTIADRHLSSSLLIWHRMMAECKVYPAVCPGEALTVLAGRVDPVQFTVEVTSPRRLGSRAVWKRRLQ